MSRWFRMYDDVLDDPKVQRLPPELFKAWVNLLCLASRNDGRLPPIEDIAFALRQSEDVTRDVTRDLSRRGLLDDENGLVPHNWNERQFKSDKDETALERKRRQRQREKDGNVTRDTSVTSRPPEQSRADTDTEVRGAILARDPDADLEAKLRTAAGWSGHPAPKLAITGPIQALLDSGADLELDVLPVIRALAPKARIPGWNYFVGAIAQARDDRISAATVVSLPTSNSRIAHAANRQKPSRSETFAAIRGRIEQLAEAERRAAGGGDQDPRDPAEGQA